MKLATKLNLILLVNFLTVAVISGWFLSQLLAQKVEQEISDKAFLMIETMNSVRNYTSKEITPELEAFLETENNFLPQTIPAYSARQVFEDLRQKPKYSNFLYKEVALNPTNLRHKADEFEKEIINNFRANPKLEEVTGLHTFPNGDYFYVSRPLAVSQASCLRCHGKPEDAPKSQVTAYGRENGYGWKLNEIVGAQIILVPTTQLINRGKKLQILLIGIISILFLIALISLNLFVNQSIIKPLRKMARLSKEISTGNIKEEFKHNAKDEIGTLAASLNRMKISLQMAIDMLNER